MKLKIDFQKCTSVKQFLEAIKNHKCDTKEMMSMDSMRQRKIGAVCCGCCTVGFCIDLNDAKNTLSELDDNTKAFFMRDEGRRELISSLR